MRSQTDMPFPFRSRREIALTMLGGSAALWLLNHSELARGRWGGVLGRVP